MVAAGMYFSPGEEGSFPRPRQLRVLVVDDDRDSVLTLMALLRDEGYDAKGAYTAKDALKSLQGFDPDAVLLDISLPDMSGWDVAREIRQICGDRRPLLVAVTGAYKMSADRVLAQMAGFNEYVTKPYDPDQLLRLIAPLASNP
jgi:CheY-like chemotaxis protein